MPSSSSLWDTVFLLLWAILSFPIILKLLTPKSCSKPLSLPIKLPPQSTRGLALVCTYVCSWLGPSGTSALVFLHKAASGKSEARGQQKEKDAHQLSQTSPVFSPLISQLLNIFAGGCHSLPVWLRRRVKLLVSRDNRCYCVSGFCLNYTDCHWYSRWWCFFLSCLRSAAAN